MRHIKTSIFNADPTKLLFIAAFLPLITSCASMSSQKPNSGSLSSDSAKNLLKNLKRTVDSNTKLGNASPGMSSEGINKLQHENTTVGSQLNSSDSLLNNGKSFTGLRVIVQGSAFSQGFLGAPNSVSVSVATSKSEGSSPFIMTAPSVYGATVPNVICEKNVSIQFDAPALRAGDCDYEMSVTPLDGSMPAVTFKHTCTIKNSSANYANRANPTELPSFPTR